MYLIQVKLNNRFYNLTNPLKLISLSFQELCYKTENVSTQLTVSVFTRDPLSRTVNPGTTLRVVKPARAGMVVLLIVLKLRVLSVLKDRLVCVTVKTDLVYIQSHASFCQLNRSLRITNSIVT